MTENEHLDLQEGMKSIRNAEFMGEYKKLSFFPFWIAWSYGSAIFLNGNKETDPNFSRERQHAYVCLHFTNGLLVETFSMKNWERFDPVVCRDT